MWVPNTDPSGSGLIAATRYRGQEGAAADAPLHAHLGVLGVTGFLMQDLSANPLDYVEGGPLNGRREELSRILDATSPDLVRVDPTTQDCPNCSAQNPPDALFCEACGYDYTTGTLPRPVEPLQFPAPPALPISMTGPPSPSTGRPSRVCRMPLALTARLPLRV